MPNKMVIPGFSVKKYWQLGRSDLRFLERSFQGLMLNFNWWVNRKDPSGRNVFAGGFLGLDNIGVFDRSPRVARWSRPTAPPGWRFTAPGTFLRDADGRRPVYGGSAKFQEDPHWRDLILFYAALPIRFCHLDYDSFIRDNSRLGRSGSHRIWCGGRKSRSMSG